LTARRLISATNNKDCALQAQQHQKEGRRRAVEFQVRAIGHCSFVWLASERARRAVRGFGFSFGGFFFWVSKHVISLILFDPQSKVRTYSILAGATDN